MSFESKNITGTVYEYVKGFQQGVNNFIDTIDIKNADKHAGKPNFQGQVNLTVNGLPEPDKIRYF
ncbi:hypothetical protein NO2_1194 [Candidatus Termititenax persephonae]|uniref:Uncharacterized protein n=1 Tax=Candidatus Termititenax persephonae TaxID=2218525 RepID=A0A388THQ9_9BACT|nr:hypothetical protein NO2_1194 [Candidatus Termititenax persephonae]